MRELSADSILLCLTCRCYFRPVRRCTTVSHCGLMIQFVCYTHSHWLHCHVIPFFIQCLQSLTVWSVYRRVRYCCSTVVTPVIL